MSSPNKPVVLHIASDHPGLYSPGNVTSAIKSLIGESSVGLDNLVLVPRRSRAKWRLGKLLTPTELHLRSFSPFSPLFSTSPWQQVSCRQEVMAWLNGRKPDVIHSHKLTYEALIGSDLADELKIPHVVSIRGSSDTNLRNFKFSAGLRYRRILDNSALNLWVSAWAQEPLKRLTGYHPAEKDVLFPNAVTGTRNADPRKPWIPNSLVTIGRLDDYEQKGILPLLRGVAKLGANVTLDLVGPAHARARRAIEREIDRLDLGNRVRMLGPRSREEIGDLVSSYAAMVLLSTAETFGLVYIEALLAGVPVVYMRGSGIDGYQFASANGIGCSSRDESDVTRALVELLGRQEELRISLACQLRQGALESLNLKSQAETYTRLIKELITVR